MSKKPFQFKQFSVQQDRCAMKVGTDGVLLGAWTSLDHNPGAILDIGAGTGVIALMLAQRCEAFQIDALEIEENAYEQAVENFEASHWGDRLFCYHAGFDEFVEEMQDEEKYDLIISNPPFFSEDFKSGNNHRDQARFADALPLTQLIEGASLLLSENGHLDIVIPFSKEENATAIAENSGLFPRKITRVRGTEDSPIKRSLISFHSKKSETTIDELIIEISRHNYTQDYKELVKDFYLKL